MKKYFVILLFIPSLCGAQIFQQRQTYAMRHTITARITLDSTQTQTVYIGLTGEGSGIQYAKTTAIVPTNSPFYDGKLLITGQIDSTVAAETDSITGYVVPLDNEGYVIPDTAYFDFQNMSSTTTAKYIDWVPHNRSDVLGVTANTFTINLNNRYTYPIFGLKLVMTQVMKNDVTNQTANLKIKVVH